MHSDSGGAGRFRNLLWTSSRGWPSLDLPGWIGLQGPDAEQLSSQGCRTTWGGNVEGSTPTVCQSRDDGRLGMEGERSNKISNCASKGRTEADPSWPLRPVSVFLWAQVVCSLHTVSLMALSTLESKSLPLTPACIHSTFIHVPSSHKCLLGHPRIGKGCSRELHISRLVGRGHETNTQ